MSKLRFSTFLSEPDYMHCEAVTKDGAPQVRHKNRRVRGSIALGVRAKDQHVEIAVLANNRGTLVQCGVYCLM